MDREIWEYTIYLYLNLPDRIESEKLDTYWDRGWSPHLTAQYLRDHLAAAHNHL